LGISNYTSIEDLYNQVRDRYAIQLGELESNCVVFLQNSLEEYPPTAETRTQIEQAASCLKSPQNCTGINADDLEPYLNEIEICASHLGQGTLESLEDEVTFAEHLIISAPWSSQDQWHESCVNLLESLSKDAGGYWELLGRALASKRGN
jgi:hypothetical protein